MIELQALSSSKVYEHYSIPLRMSGDDERDYWPQETSRVSLGIVPKACGEKVRIYGCEGESSSLTGQYSHKQNMTSRAGKSRREL